MSDNPGQSSLDSFLDSEQRERLCHLATVLIAGGDGFPTPSEIGLQNEWIDRVVTAWPAITDVVTMVVTTEGDPVAVIESLQTDQPAVFGGFAMAVSAAYLMHPKVRSLLGYSGQALKAEPPADGEWEFYLEDGILQPVLERGPFLRAVPEGM